MVFGVWVFLTSYLSWVAADKSLLSAFVCFWKARIFGRVSESPGSAEFHSVGPGVVAKWAWDVPGSLRLAKRGNGEAASGLELRPGAPPSVVQSQRPTWLRAQRGLYSRCEALLCSEEGATLHGPPCCPFPPAYTIHPRPHCHRPGCDVQGTSPTLLC